MARRLSDRFLNPGFIGVLPIVGGALCLFAFVGCSGCRSIAPEPDQLPLKFEMEHLADERAAKITREEPFPWHRVEFRLNKDYVYTEDLVRDPEITIPYSRFHHEVTGDIYDPREREPFRMHITAAEGFGHLP
jgi:hypothetical protein